MPEVQNNTEQSNVENNHDKTVVFYHHPCLDGAAAVWAAWRVFGDQAIYVGADHNDYQGLADNIDTINMAEAQVYFLDFVPEETLLRHVLKQSGKVFVLDHHKSVQDMLHNLQNEYAKGEDRLQIVFDLNRSGGGIAWDYFQKGQDRPPVLQAVEAIDLHQHHFLGAEDDDLAQFFAIAAYLDHFDLSSMTEIIKVFEALEHLSLSEMVERGAVYRDMNLKRIHAALEGREYIRFPMVDDLAEVEIPFVNANVYELGREFIPVFLECCTHAGIKMAIAWQKDGNGLWRMNIRTDGKYPANELAHYLAQSYGLNGGGHMNSAAVRFTGGQFKRLMGEVSLKTSA